MKKYKRKEFIKLPAQTIYSRISLNPEELMYGLFCKTSGDEFNGDWAEQDLISEGGFPEGISSGYDAIQHVLNLRDTFKDFETDLDCGGRDGFFEDSDEFVVWDKKDITKLRDYLSSVLR